MAGPDKIRVTVAKVLQTLIDLCELDSEQDWYFPAAQVAHEMNAGSDGYGFVVAVLDTCVEEGKAVSKQSEFGTLYRAVSQERESSFIHV
ncbi:MAG: hypothetical protein F4X41_07380 [Chloroflexi bacterium]|nr:hypothetical protein [Chloroflexota bacterium]